MYFDAVVVIGMVSLLLFRLPMAILCLVSYNICISPIKTLLKLSSIFIRLLQIYTLIKYVLPASALAAKDFYHFITKRCNSVSSLVFEITRRDKNPFHLVLASIYENSAL
jgi:hypothetical protein